MNFFHHYQTSVYRVDIYSRGLMEINDLFNITHFFIFTDFFTVFILVLYR